MNRITLGVALVGTYMFGVLALALPQSFQRVSWDGLSLQIPSGWRVEQNEERLSAENPLGTESLVVSHYGIKPGFLGPDPTPDDVMAEFARREAIPDTGAPETFALRPAQTFRFSCGEPGVMRVSGLGADEYVVLFALAHSDGFYTISFYQTGDPGSRVGFYQSLIRSARLGSTSKDC